MTPGWFNGTGPVERGGGAPTTTADDDDGEIATTGAAIWVRVARFQVPVAVYDTGAVGIGGVIPDPAGTLAITGDGKAPSVKETGAVGTATVGTAAVATVDGAPSFV